jgi:hypothetical protein
MPGKCLTDEKSVLMVNRKVALKGVKLQQEEVKNMKIVRQVSYMRIGYFGKQE